MSPISTTLVFAVLVAVCSVNSIHAEKIDVTVYYASLCMDSMNFVARQLGPNYPKFKDFINIHFVPYGKASYVMEGNEPKFACQHGPMECEGNLAHSCALHEIEQTIASQDDQDQKSVEFVNCAMTSPNPTTAWSQCIQSLGLPSSASDHIKECISGPTGNQLGLKNAEKTREAESPLRFVPTITIKGTKSPEAFRNFAGAICKAIPKDKQPEACVGSS